jgi:hypothetical protein
LSANTIKTHVQAIYRKLGVSMRRDAVEQGREAGLLLSAVRCSPPAIRSARAASRGGPPHCGEPPTACGRCS